MVLHTIASCQTWRTQLREQRRHIHPKLSSSSQSLRRSAPAQRQRPVVSTSAKRDDKQRAVEDELRDPSNFVEYFLPRPLRLAFFGVSAASCLVASVLTALQLPQAPAGSSAPKDLVVNLIGMAVFAALFVYDQQAAGQRIEKRAKIRQAQIARGDREVYLNDDGEKMSRLKEVDDAWILRRLERWGQRDGMPFVGPKKGAILQQLVADKRPRLAVEVGTLAGYSALLIAQALPPGGRLVSYEKDFTWWLVANRFLFQANGGLQPRGARVGERVSAVWGDAREKLAAFDSARQGKIDFLFLDGIPKETLEYLKAAEPHLAPGAMVVADNAGVFAAGGMAPFLAYVRNDPKYKSSFIESTLEWRDDVKDGIEVAFYNMPADEAAASLPSTAAKSAEAAKAPSS